MYTLGFINLSGVCPGQDKALLVRLLTQLMSLTLSVLFCFFSLNNILLNQLISKQLQFEKLV